MSQGNASQSLGQYSILFSKAHASMGHGEPRTFTWVAIFFSPSSLVPAPHVEQRLRRFSLQTSQFTPQAPVGIIDPYI